MKRTGGPAFAAAVPPTETQACGIFDGVFQEGMSLRDYFAGQAMVTRLENYSESWKELAESAYQIADAMLAEREKETK